MTCEHTYKIYYKNSDVYYCFDCCHILSPFLFPKKEQKEYKECIAPPMFEDFTKKRWDEVKPWNISYKLAKENYFYFGMQILTFGINSFLISSILFRCKFSCAHKTFVYTCFTALAVFLP